MQKHQYEIGDIGGRHRYERCAIDWKHSFILEINLRTVFENYPIQNVSG